jgi:hypothetical protein
VSVVTQAQLLESIVRFLTEEGRPTDEATIMATARINLEYLQGSPSSFFAPSIAAYKVLLGIVDAPAVPRPRYAYRLPDGTDVMIPYDHGETPRPWINFELKAGPDGKRRIINVPLVSKP